MNSFIRGKALKNLKLTVIHVAASIAILIYLKAVSATRLTFPVALLPLLGAASSFKSLWKVLRGSYAEDLVAQELKSIKGKVIRNFRFKHGDIDFIVISTKGIFPLEVKSVKGRVRLIGDVAYYGKYNLLRQVDEAEKFLIRAFPEYVDQIRGLLVVEGGWLEGRSDRVIRRHQLKRVLSGRTVLKEKDVDRVYEVLRRGSD